MKLSEITQLNESSLSRVWKHSQDHDIGTITAFRFAPECGNGTPYTKAENKQRNAKLKAQLLKHGFGVTAVKGTYIENYGTDSAREVSEDVFLVVDLKDTGKLKNHIKKLGEEWDQDSILFMPKGGKTGQLIGTNKCPDSYPGYGKTLKLNNALFGDKGEFHTKVNGRPFTLKEDASDLITVNGFFGKYSVSVIAEMDWRDIEL